MCRILLQALAQDQLRALLELTGGAQTAQKFGIGVYDGDTNQELRLRLRESARVVPAKALIEFLFIFSFFAASVQWLTPRSADFLCCI
jgi:hypothetical protein